MREKSFGDRHEIVVVRLNLRKMPRGNKSATRRHGEALVHARDRKPRAERQRLDRRLLDVGGRENQRAQRRDFVRRRAHRLGERVRRQPADIAVGFELPPAPAFAGRLVDRHALALERLGVERRFVRGRAAQRRLRRRSLRARCLRRSARPRTRPSSDFAARSGRAGVSHRDRGSHGINRNALSEAHRAPAPPGIRRLRDGRAWPPASTRKCRNAPTPSPG